MFDQLRFSRLLHLKQLGRLLALCAALSLTQVVTTDNAFAQDSGDQEVRAQEDPVQLIFINSDPSDGTRVHDAVKSVLDMSDDLNLIDPDRFLSAGMNHSVRLETLRDGEQRAEFASGFKETLREVDGEGLVILDVFGGGRTMQLVVVGPEGQELADIRQRISPGEPTQGETVEALKKVFKVLIPEIRQFRQRQEEEQQVNIGLVDEDEPPVEEDNSIKARAIAERRRAHGDLTRGVTPRAGLLFGSRNLNVETEGNYQLTHASPFVGFGLDVDAVFALFDGHTSAVGSSLFLGYAPFTTVLSDESGQSIEKSSSFFNFHLDLHYIKGIGEGMRVQGTLGFETLSISADESEDYTGKDPYTGNSYVNLRAGAGLIYQFGELAEFRLEALALPVLSADVSNNRLGEADFGLGIDVGARLELIAFGPFRAAAAYHLKYYPVDFPEPEDPDLESHPAESSDFFHVAHLVFGYDF